MGHGLKDMDWRIYWI